MLLHPTIIVLSVALGSVFYAEKSLAQNSTPQTSKKEIATFHLEKDAKEPRKKNAIGLLSWDDLSRFPIEKQYKQYVDTTNVNHQLLDKLSLNPHHYQLLIFGGLWWCSDTRDILSKLMFYIHKSNFDTEKILFVGLNTKKQGVRNLSQLFQITNVPTIILLKDGKEAHRLVEYGKSGNWENELFEILSSE